MNPQGLELFLWPIKKEHQSPSLEKRIGIVLRRKLNRLFRKFIAEILHTRVSMA